MSGFHEVLFPLEIALGSRGGPQRSTDIVTLGSGREERNQRWHHSRRRYNAGYGIKTLDRIAAAIAFYEERRGRLYGFRWRDRLDSKSCKPSQAISPLDQAIGAGDGQTTQFQLVKTYGSLHAPYARLVRKPVAGSVRIAIDGAELSAGDFSVDASTGIATLAIAPENGKSLTAGFEFDVPVRFDTDYFEIDIAAFEAGEIPDLPIVEILV